MPPELTGIAADYVPAVNAHQAEAVVTLFAPDAYVNDARREIHGVDAIRRWVDKEIIGDDITMQVREVHQHHDETIVRSVYDGTFDRTDLPDELVLTDYLRVRDGKIVSLIIIRNQPSPYEQGRPDCHASSARRWPSERRAPAPPEPAMDSPEVDLATACSGRPAAPSGHPLVPPGFDVRLTMQTVGTLTLMEEPALPAPATVRSIVTGATAGDHGVTRRPRRHHPPAILRSNIVTSDSRRPQGHPPAPRRRPRREAPTWTSPKPPRDERSAPVAWQSIPVPRPAGGPARRCSARW